MNCAKRVILAVGLPLVAAAIWPAEALACGRCEAPRRATVIRWKVRERGRVVVRPAASLPVATTSIPAPMATPQAPAKVMPDPVSSSPAGFLYDLNALRSRYNLPAVAEDVNLSAWSVANNGEQLRRGLGHHIMGPARRQNAGWGPYHAVWRGWLASGPHLDALVDPTITRVGIAQSGDYWTFNAQ